MCRFALLLAIVMAVSELHAQAPEGLVPFTELNNEVVLKMVREKIPDETIISLIESNPTQFDTSAKGREQLIQGGVSKPVMGAILKASRRTPQATARPVPPPVAAPPGPSVTAKPAPLATAQPAPARTAPSQIPSSSPPGTGAPPSSASSPPAQPTVASRTPTASATANPAAAPESVPRVVTPEPQPASPPSAPPVYYSTESEEDDAPRAEVFGGVTYSWRGAGSNQMGWNGAVNGNLNRWFGVVADLSSRPSFQPSRFLGYNLGRDEVFLLLFGPQFTARTGRIDGFARALVGSQHSRGPMPSLPSGWHLSYGLGGGADVRLARHFALRAIQWDVLRTKRAENDSLTEHRLAFGAVVRF